MIENFTSTKKAFHALPTFLHRFIPMPGLPPKTSTRYTEKRAPKKIAMYALQKFYK